MELLTVAEVAAILRLDESSVYALAASGELPRYKVGPKNGGVRIAREDVDAYLTECRQSKNEDEEPQRAPRPRLKHLRI